MREIGALRKRGYSTSEIATKTDFSDEYVNAICYLLEHGEERLLAGIERGVIPRRKRMKRSHFPTTRFLPFGGLVLSQNWVAGKGYAAVR